MNKYFKLLFFNGIIRQKITNSQFSRIAGMNVPPKIAEKCYVPLSKKLVILSLPH